MSDKTSNFLRAIDKYAKKEQSQIIEEIKKIEDEEIKKAEEGIMDDVRNMIANEIGEVKNKLSIEISKKISCERKKIDDFKNKMLRDVLESCKQKLLSYTKTDEYINKLQQYATKILNICGDEYVEIKIRPLDLGFSDSISKIFDKNCKIFCDNNIKLGGIIGNCPSKSLIIDHTFDSNLPYFFGLFIDDYGAELLE